MNEYWTSYLLDMKISIREFAHINLKDDNMEVLYKQIVAKKVAKKSTNAGLTL